jgi:hypothetical protein
MVEAVFEEMRRLHKIVKPPEPRATSLRFRVPRGLDPESCAETMRRVLEKEKVRVHVTLSKGKRYINVGYNHWKKEYSERVKEKRHERIQAERMDEAGGGEGEGPAGDQRDQSEQELLDFVPQDHDDILPHAGGLGDSEP